MNWIEKVKLPNNWVCIKVDDSNEWVNLGKEKIKLDVTFEKEKHAQTVGTVVNVCENIFFSQKSVPSHPWDVPIEIQPGDTVVFHYLTLKNAKDDGKIDHVDGVQYAFIPYADIFCAVRGGEILPVNGWVFVEPEKDVPNTFLSVPDIAKKDSEITGTILYAGAKAMAYHGKESQGAWVWEDPDVSVGDKVFFNSTDAIPLQYEFHSITGKKLYRMRRKDILAVLA